MESSNEKTNDKDNSLQHKDNCNNNEDFLSLRARSLMKELEEKWGNIKKKSISSNFQQSSKSKCQFSFIKKNPYCPAEFFKIMNEVKNIKFKNHFNYHKKEKNEFNDFIKSKKEELEKIINNKKPLEFLIKSKHNSSENLFHNKFKQKTKERAKIKIYKSSINNLSSFTNSISKINKIPFNKEKTKKVFQEYKSKFYSYIEREPSNNSNKYNNDIYKYSSNKSMIISMTGAVERLSPSLNSSKHVNNFKRTSEFISSILKPKKYNTSKSQSNLLLSPQNYHL